MLKVHNIDLKTVIGVSSKKDNCRCMMSSAASQYELTQAEYLYVLQSSPIFIQLNSSIAVVSMLCSIRAENSVDPGQTTRILISISLNP